MAIKVAFIVLSMRGIEGEARSELNELVEYIKNNVKFWRLEKVTVIPEESQ